MLLTVLPIGEFAEVGFSLGRGGETLLSAGERGLVDLGEGALGGGGEPLEFGFVQNDLSGQLSMLDTQAAEAGGTPTLIYCFSKGTEVETPSGKVNIEEIKEGDEVLSYDFKEEKVVVRKVTELVRKATEHWYIIGIGNHYGWPSRQVFRMFQLEDWRAIVWLK